MIGASFTLSMAVRTFDRALLTRWGRAFGAGGELAFWSCVGWSSVVGGTVPRGMRLMVMSGPL